MKKLLFLCIVSLPLLASGYEAETSSGIEGASHLGIIDCPTIAWQVYPADYSYLGMDGQVYPADFGLWSAHQGKAWELTCAICGEKEESSYCDQPGCLVLHNYDRPELVCGLDLCYHCREAYRAEIQSAMNKLVSALKVREKARIEEIKKKKIEAHLREYTEQVKKLTEKLAELKKERTQVGGLP